MAARPYPRSRGATRTKPSASASRRGLSPLARGNRQHPAASPARRGPIPARAGQPSPTCLIALLRRAYPRSRGATDLVAKVHALKKGLSPLARGNLHHHVGDGLYLGPIPARAGQPISPTSLMLAARAYPRSRGATAYTGGGGEHRVGLSPLARGNPLGESQPRRENGPIPARAGQPTRAESISTLATAYPRSRGATTGSLPTRSAGQGLSPLARGNQPGRRRIAERPGPIPARAGQPSCSTVVRRLGWAYPRSRGATSPVTIFRRDCRGLSPLARGNLGLNAQADARAGPIPARAGQPRSQCSG